MKIKIKQHVALVYRYPIAFVPISLLFLILSILLLPEYSYASNQALLKSIDYKRVDNNVNLSFTFSEAMAEPKTFILHNPDRIVLDFPNALLGTKPVEYIKMGNVRKVVFKESAEKLRAIIYLTKFNNYTTDIDGNTINVTIEDTEKKPEELPEPVKFIEDDDSLDPIWGKIPPPIENEPEKTTDVTIPPQETKPIAPEPLPSATTSMHEAKGESVTLSNKDVEDLWANSGKLETSSPYNNQKQLGKVDFRRDADGNAKIIINLPSANTIVTDKQNGSSIYLLMKDVDIPQHLRQRLDVLDFATPVNYIEVAQKDTGAKISIFTQGNIKYTKEQDGSRYTLRVMKKKPKVTKKKQKVFKGEKLSLNFQDIEVRSVLQLLADFTNKNIVVSDTVDGNITLRLKDVPWDQALDIVLETKNLAMRKNGNVIWVAPAAELAAKEQQELEAEKRKDDLQSLITEYISINFAKATDLADLIQKSRGEKTHSLLSARGSVSLDERTNTLLIQDTEKRVNEIRKLVEALDVPVQQVLVESRVVVANDTFSKELGTRFGVTPTITGNSGIISASGSLDATETMASSVATNLASSGSPYSVAMPTLANRLNINLPVEAAKASALGFSILAKDFLLDLELSALQAENEGEVIATPRVITSNQSQATIEQGVEIPYQQASSSGATNTSFKKAVLSMDVTPQITPDEHIVMDLRIHQDTVGEMFNNIPSINTRQIHTKVLVENGQTIVLGGVHEEENLDSVNKVPVLGDLPVVGNMFRKTLVEEKKRELLIFVTPKIIDEF
jgi:type IV pilus assembly protein PilQ